MSSNFPDLGTLDYPVYVVQVPKAKELNVTEFGQVLLGYKLKGKLYCHDCFTKTDWDRKTTKKLYNERLAELRHTLSEIAQYTKFIDSPIQVSNPVELKEFYKKTLTEGFKGVRIYSSSSNYSFTDATENYWELFPRKVEIE